MKTINRYEVIATGGGYGINGERIGLAPTLTACDRIVRRVLTVGQRASAHRIDSGEKCGVWFCVLGGNRNGSHRRFVRVQQ